jgi:hypothetical protein
MDANTQHETESTHVPPFNPDEHMMAASSGRHFVATTVKFDPALWERTKPMVAPMVWAWYESHKDQKVAKLGGFYQVTIGSFGIAEMVLAAVFGPRPA